MPSPIYILGKIIVIESTKPQFVVNGEIIYLGYSVPETRNIHVHHVANTEGHPHSELIDAKWETREIRIEHCTDVDGARPHMCPT